MSARSGTPCVTSSRLPPTTRTRATDRSGMPAVPVFGLSFNGPDNPGGKGPLRAATHGRGIWEIDIPNLVDLFADGFE